MKEELIKLTEETKKLSEEINNISKDNNDIVTVPFVVYESEMKRKQTLIIILIICWFLTIAGIVVYSCIPSEEYSQKLGNINDNNHIKQVIGGD